MKLRANIPSIALRGSLRLRLLLGTLVWIAVSLIVAGWALGGLFRQHVSTQFHAGLNAQLDHLAAHLAVDANGQVALAVAQSDPRFSKPYSGIYWQIDRVGAVPGEKLGLLRSRSLWDDVIKVPPDVPGDGEIHQHRVPGPGDTMLGALERLVVLEENPVQTGKKYRLIVAADEQQMVEPAERFNGMLWMTLGLLGGGLALAVVIQVKIALVPLRSLHAALAAVHTGKSRHLEGNFPGEVQPLVSEFNTVLAQNAGIVERARTQAGNLAHALKTPLSVIANAANGQPGDLARLVSAQVDVARRQIDYHLSRSRVAASVYMPGARTPVQPVVAGLVRVMRRIYAERELELNVHPASDPIIFRGEAQDLQEMLGNLLDNACKWAGHRIDVMLEMVGEDVRITLDDDGCGVAEAERKRVLDRGERADERVQGHGLGLSIVGDLARLYGGQIELADSPLGGLRVILVLPGAE